MRKEKKGFSIKLFTKDDVNDYVVYFEEKHSKIVFCYIQDSYLDITFKGRSVCHKEDVFDIEKGREIAFQKALEKRDRSYERVLKNITRNILSSKNNNTAIEHKFYKFNEKN